MPDSTTKAAEGRRRSLLTSVNGLLAVPSLFDGYQSLIGVPRCHRRLISEHLRPRPGERVLDIGCGVGATARLIPADVDYVGIDIDEAYIATARRSHPGRKFFAMDIDTADAALLGGAFDRAFAFGVLHHLPDEVARHLVDFVARTVKPGGRFVTIDPCYAPSQPAIAKLLIDGDRGRHVRDEAGFRRLVDRLGPVSVAVSHDMLRVPFTQIVMAIDLPSQAVSSIGPSAIA